MKFYDLAAIGKADTGAFIETAVMYTLENQEYPFLMLRFDTDAIVLNGKFPFIAFARC